jgi:hypothetical protein
LDGKNKKIFFTLQNYYFLNLFYNSLSKDSEIKSLSQITNDDFARILLKICKKIIQHKGMEMSMPEVLSRDLNTKYRECQKIVDFIKHLGYKADLNLNNILFPSIRDIQRTLEYTLEYITNSDTGVIDFGENISEKNFAKIKIHKQLLTWSKETWLVPELKPQIRNIAIQKSMIKIDKLKLNNIKKKINSLQNFSVPENLNTISQNKLEELYSSENAKLITEDEYNLSNSNFLKNQNSNFLVEKLKRKNKVLPQEKTTNQQFVELINKRGNFVEFIQKNYHENNFINNIKIIEKKNKDIFGTFKSVNNFQNDSTINNESKLDTTSNTIDENQSQKLIYQKKIDFMIENYEKEKEVKNLEIKELSIKIQSLINSIQQHKNSFWENENKKENLNSIILELSNKNENLLKDIEEKLETFEQIQKMNKKEINEDEINSEVSTLEKKYDEMISNWDEYSGQAKSRIEELKNSIETKKKEYNFKYEKISQIKKEIDEISTKIGLKNELANFLNEEYQKIPLDINRNKFITKISELTSSISQEKNNIYNYISDLKNLENQIHNINETIKKVDNELEDKLYQDVKNNTSLKDLYASFIKIRDGYNVIQKNIIDTQHLKTKLKELENKVEDYQLKLKSYDINQLNEQVEILRIENSKVFK